RSCALNSLGKAVHPVRYDAPSGTQSHPRLGKAVKKRILVVDVGGSNVKLMISRAQKRKFKSGPDLAPREMLAQMKPLLQDWKFDAVSMGFPAPVRNGRIMSEPKNLGPGMKQLGEKAWKREVLRAVLLLKKSLIADYVVVGGGSAKKFDQLPEGIELGHNRNAFLGGVRLWQIDPRTRRAKWRIM